MELAVGVRPVSMAEMRPVQPVHAPVSYMGDGATGSSSHMLSSFVPRGMPKCAGEKSDMLISLVGVHDAVIVLGAERLEVQICVSSVVLFLRGSCSLHDAKLFTPKLIDGGSIFDVVVVISSSGSEEACGCDCDCDGCDAKGSTSSPRPGVEEAWNMVPRIGEVVRCLSGYEDRVSAGCDAKTEGCPYEFHCVGPTPYENAP